MDCLQLYGKLPPELQNLVEKLYWTSMSTSARYVYINILQNHGVDYNIISRMLNRKRIHLDEDNLNKLSSAIVLPIKMADSQDWYVRKKRSNGFIVLVQGENEHSVVLQDSDQTTEEVYMKHQDAGDFEEVDADWAQLFDNIFP